MSIAGTQFHFVALPWVVLGVTGSGLALGGVLTAAAIPRAAFMLLGGAMTDRVSPRRVMLLSNLTRAVLAGLLAFAIASDRTAVSLLYVVGGLFGVADAMFYPAYTALVPRLVPGPSLAAANSLIQGTAHTVGLAAPAAAGVVIVAAGPATAFGVDAASFVFAAAMLSGIRGGGGAPAAAVPGVLAAIAGGFAYVRSHPHLRALLLMIARRSTPPAPRVPAPAGVLDETLSPRYRPHAVHEESARVPDALSEHPPAGETVRVLRKQKRMAAADACVLAHAVTLGEQPVGMVTQEAAQRMPNVGRPAVGVQVGRATPARRRRPARGGERAIVDHVAPEGAGTPIDRAPDLPQKTHFTHAAECVNHGVGGSGPA